MAYDADSGLPASPVSWRFSSTADVVLRASNPRTSTTLSGEGGREKSGIFAFHSRYQLPLYLVLATAHICTPRVLVHFSSSLVLQLCYVMYTCRCNSVPFGGPIDGYFETARFCEIHDMSGSDKYHAPIDYRQWPLNRVRRCTFLVFLTSRCCVS